MLLAEIVEAAAGTDLQSFLRNRIFRPLDVDMVMDGASEIRGRAVPYELLDGVLHSNAAERWEQIGDGALQTTASELVRWADNFRRPIVGGPDLVRAQLEDTVDIGAPDGARYGAGLFVLPDGRFGHPGEWLGFIGGFAVSSDRTRSVAVLCNNWDLDFDAISAQMVSIWLLRQ